MSAFHSNRVHSVGFNKYIYQIARTYNETYILREFQSFSLPKLRTFYIIKISLKIIKLKYIYVAIVDKI